jgi:hypothetical protein
MFVVKRDGKKETVKFDKITARIEKLCYGFNPALVDPIDVAKKVIEGLPGCRNCRLVNYQTPGLCFACITYRGIKPAQKYGKVVLRNHAQTA